MNTIIQEIHHWPTGYYFKDGMLWMDHKIFTQLKEDKFVDNYDPKTRKWYDKSIIDTNNIFKKKI